jgi:dsRNA-specific ribonuclease
MEDQHVEIYSAPRGNSFMQKIKTLLKMGKLKKEYISLLTDDEGMELYRNAFTHISADENNNYEYLEQLGDVTVNKAIVWYLSRRFPKLNCPQGVKIIARLRIKLVSKKSFSDFGIKLRLWEFVSAEVGVKQNEKKAVLEDVFESFFGATELLIDQKIRQGAGYAICNNIIVKLFDDIEISLAYNDLFDAVTRLKELFDYYRPIKDGEERERAVLGQVKYENRREQTNQDAGEGVRPTYWQYVSVFAVKNGNRELIATGNAALKADAKQNAAENALIIFKRRGYTRPIPEIYNDIE